ncbi:hypothetical protein Scep_004949 [Stephania cephalantha]|uniref:Secreted protein n=1 Tax=Stephania cephalantha TaxID=152367 RepID=A0AAP0KUA7_9MAGN
MLCSVLALLSSLLALLCFGRHRCFVPIVLAALLPPRTALLLCSLLALPRCSAPSPHCPAALLPPRTALLWSSSRLPAPAVFALPCSDRPRVAHCALIPRVSTSSTSLLSYCALIQFAPRCVSLVCDILKRCIHVIEKETV